MDIKPLITFHKYQILIKPKPHSWFYSILNNFNRGSNLKKTTINISTMNIGLGEYIALEGLNGSGKSTFLKSLRCENRSIRQAYFEAKGNLIFHLKEYGIPERPIATFNQKELDNLRKKIIYISQEVFFHSSDSIKDALLNGAIEYVYRERFSQQERKRLIDIAENKFEYFKNRYIKNILSDEQFKKINNLSPDTLSGGQKRLLYFLGQMLLFYVKEVFLLLIDEPLNNLDFENIMDINDLILDVKDDMKNQGRQLTIIVISHQKLLFGIDFSLEFEIQSRKTKQFIVNKKPWNQNQKFPSADTVRINNNRYRGTTHG